MRGLGFILSVERIGVTLLEKRCMQALEGGGSCGRGTSLEKVEPGTMGGSYRRGMSGKTFPTTEAIQKEADSPSRS